MAKPAFSTSSVSALKGARPPRLKKVYVKVNSDFDPTGYILPRAITWEDGRTFKIEAVKDFRPAACYRQGVEGACYTIMIREKNAVSFSSGQTRPLLTGLPAGTLR